MVAEFFGFALSGEVSASIKVLGVILPEVSQEIFVDDLVADTDGPQLRKFELHRVTVKLLL